MRHANNGHTGLIRKEPVLACLDLLIFYLVTLAALAIRFGGAVPPAHMIPYLVLTPILVPWRLLVVYSFGLYDFRRRLAVADHVFGGIGASLCAVAGGYLIVGIVELYYMPAMELSRLAACIDACLLAVWLAASRAVVLLYLRLSGHKVRVLIVGPSDPAREVVEEIREHASPLVEIAGVHDLPSDISQSELANLEARLEIDLGNSPVHQIVLAGIEPRQEQLGRLLAFCERFAHGIYLFPSLGMPLLASTRVVSIAGLPLVPLHSAHAARPYRVVKRAMDVSGAAVGLLICLPVVAAVAAVLKSRSRGSVFFVQERVGLHGQPFRILKLRTMIVDAETEGEPALAGDNDPRLIPGGGFARKYRIDEVPQLWNVLTGEMSLVGPRPERPEFVRRFVLENPLYDRRFLVKPGLTGLAQIHGRYDSEYSHKLRYDLVYMNNISFATDIRILLATIRTVLTGHGAT